MIPYAKIIEGADRRWTARLLQRLDTAGLPDEELDELTSALQAVSDWRSFADLEAMVVDTSRPAGIREAAGAALRGLHHVAHDPKSETLRRWWHEGDDILRRHALLSMDSRSCPDIVAQIASNPQHPWQAEALNCMDWGFDLAQYESIKINGLSHAHADVRSAAASVLLFDEPVAAEAALIAAANDPAPDVAAEAANTLQYYPTLQVIRCLYALQQHVDVRVRHEACESYEDIRSELRNCLAGNDRVAGRIRHWLRPIWELLAFTEAELQPDTSNSDWPHARDHRLLPLPDLAAMLSNTEVSPQAIEDRLWWNDWSRYSEENRRQLRPWLLFHGDPLMRRHATRAFGAWQDMDALFHLVNDDDFCVRRSAMFHLSELPPTPAIANLAWEVLQRADTLGTHASETLQTFVRHAAHDAAIRQLVSIASNPRWREELRGSAVCELTKLRAADQIQDLMPLLQEPPEITWYLHLALLQAVSKLELPPRNVRHLLHVDHLHVQQAIAPWIARMDFTANLVL